MRNKGFTIIEILVVVAIISIFSMAIMVSVGESRRKARINSTMTALRSALPIVVSCNDDPIKKIGFPETGDKQICSAKSPDSLWPELLPGYAYVGGDYTENCNFEISTNDQAFNIVCDCVKQTCQ